MDLKIVVLREVSQKEKEKQHMKSFICRSYLQKRNRLTDLENRICLKGSMGKGIS